MKKKDKNKKLKPLERHKLVSKTILENLGKGEKMSVSQAMRKNGYSEAYSKNPQQFKKTRSWDLIMKEDFNDELLSQEHLKLLHAKELAYFVFPKKMEDEEIRDKVEAAGLEVIVIRSSEKGKMAFYSIDNSKAKKDALDMAYKLKSKYAPEVFNLKFKGFSKGQLIDLILGKIAKK